MHKYWSSYVNYNWYKIVPLHYRALGSTINVLVKRLLDKNPENRPSSDYILSLSALKPYIKRHESKDSHQQLKERRHSLPNVSTRHPKEGKGRKSILVSADKENVCKNSNYPYKHSRQRKYTCTCNFLTYSWIQSWLEEHTWWRTQNLSNYPNPQMSHILWQNRGRNILYIQT